MEVPIDEPIRIELVSNDVMHEFFVPAFFFMRNAMPGHPNSFTFTPTKFGTFPGSAPSSAGLALADDVRGEGRRASRTSSTWVKQERNVDPRASTARRTAGHQLHSPRRTSRGTRTASPSRRASRPRSRSSNHDAGIDHNFAIYNGLGPRSELFASAQFAGVATKSFTLPTLPPGKYYFQCNVHGPAMSGVFIVEKSADADGRSEPWRVTEASAPGTVRAPREAGARVAHDDRPQEDRDPVSGQLVRLLRDRRASSPC